MTKGNALDNYLKIFKGYKSQSEELFRVVQKGITGTNAIKITKRII